MGLVADVRYYYDAWRPGAARSVFDSRWKALRLAVSQTLDDRRHRRWCKKQEVKQHE